MSQVLRVYMSTGLPNGVGPDPGGVTQSGKSTANFSCAGVIQGSQVTVVISGTTPFATAVPNATGDGVIVTTAAVGSSYVCIVLNQSDANNWTVRTRTVADGSGAGSTFVGGRGGGARR